MQKTIIIGASIIIGFVIHAYILNSSVQQNVQQTAGEHCVDQVKKSSAYKNANREERKTLVGFHCASYNN